MPNVTRDDIYLNLHCAACHNELIIIPAHGLRVQHEDAECEAHHDPTLRIPSCVHCSKEIHALLSPDGLVWVDHETGGDVCGWDGGNEPHTPIGDNIDRRPTYTTERIRARDLKPGDVVGTRNTSEPGDHYLAVTEITHTTYGWVHAKLGTTSISARENDLVKIQRVQSTAT